MVSKAGNTLIFLSAYCLSVGIYYATSVFFGKCVIVKKKKKKSSIGAFIALSLVFILYWFVYVQISWTVVDTAVDSERCDWWTGNDVGLNDT